jgi:hypothetical protein
VYVSNGDDVHLGKRSTVLFQEDIVGFEEFPDGSFDAVERLIGSDFESINQSLIAGLGDDST